MKKALKKIFSVVLTICMVLNIAPVQITAEGDEPKIIIDQQTIGPLSGVSHSDDRDPITITAHATNGKPVEYQWWMSTTLFSFNLTEYDTSGEYVFDYNQYPGEYEIFCMIKAEGCSEIQSSRIKVKINKGPYLGVRSGILNVNANMGDMYYLHVLPELPESDMSYSVSGSAISALVTETPMLEQDSTTNEWITYLKVSSQPVGTTAIIEYKINGGYRFEDSSLNLKVISGGEEIIGVVDDQDLIYDYVGYGQKGYMGSPIVDGYQGVFDHYYEGRGATSYSSSTEPIYPGEYTVTISIPEGEEFIASKSINFSISKRELTVKYMNVTLNRNDPLEIFSFGMNYIGFTGEDNAQNCLSVLPIPQFLVKDTSVPGVYSIGFLTEAILNERGNKLYTLIHKNAVLTINALSGSCELLDIGLPSAVKEKNNVFATVDFKVSSYQPSIQVSEGASWSFVNGDVSLPIPLKVGINEIKIKVVSENKASTKIFTIYITRLPDPAAPTPTIPPTPTPPTPTIPTPPSSGTGIGITPTIPVYQALGTDSSWDEIAENIKNAKNGEVVIDMSATDTVPASFFESIAGTNTTVIFQFGDNIRWRISGDSLKALTESGTTNSIPDVNMKVILESGSIPEQVLADFKEQLADNTEDLIILSLSHEGSFGFKAYLSLYVDIEKAGKTINLFYYNPSTGKLEFQYAVKLDELGYAELPFTHASEYVLAIDDGELLRTEIDKLTMTAEETLYIGGNTGKKINLHINLTDNLKELDSKDYLYPVISFSSSNSKIASVTADGKVTAKKEGKATIKAIVKVGEVEKILTTVITVKKAYINIVKQKTSFTLGDTYTYQAVGYGITADKISWRTKEKSIVVIKSDTGKAVAKSIGSDTVYAKYGSIREEIKVTVKKKSKK